MAAFARFIERRGRAATLYEFATAGSDSWGDPTADTPTTTATKAIVRLLGTPGLTVTVAGKRVDVDAEIVVPSELVVDPSAAGERPELEVDGRRYVVWVVDRGTVEGGQRLLATRKQ